MWSVYPLKHICTVNISRKRHMCMYMELDFRKNWSPISHAYLCILYCYPNKLIAIISRAFIVMNKTALNYICIYNKHEKEKNHKILC